MPDETKKQESAPWDNNNMLRTGYVIRKSTGLSV
jgi:hypothetical protein